MKRLLILFICVFIPPIKAVYHHFVEMKTTNFILPGKDTKNQRFPAFGFHLPPAIDNFA